tara:strand:+ start:976 stop:1077 length:102 start_codon:yes stop_codon:yes gene_type:complete
MIIDQETLSLLFDVQELPSPVYPLDFLKDDQGS